MMSDYKLLDEEKLCSAIGMLINKARIGPAIEHDMSADAISMISSVIIFSVDRFSEIVSKDIEVIANKKDEGEADDVHPSDEDGETDHPEPGSEDLDSRGRPYT